MKAKKMIGLLCAAAILCGCSQRTEDVTFTGEEPDQPAYQDNLNMISPQAYSNADELPLEPGTYISIIGKNSDSAYWKMIKAGVEQAAEDLNEKLGYSGKDKIKVVYSAPKDLEDIDEQVNILDEELARYPDAIGIASIDAEACTTQFDQATENDIPVIAFDSGNSYKGIQCTCETDNAQAAATGASKICDELPEGGKVLLLVHDSQSASAVERAAGFEQEMATHPENGIAETLYYDQMEEMKKAIAAEENGAVFAAEEEAGEEEDSAGAAEESQDAEENQDAEVTAEDITDAEVLEYYLEKHPDVKGIFGTNVTATQWALETLRENEDEEMILMGFDAGKEQLEALKSSEIDGLVVQNPFGMGYSAVIAAARTILDLGNEAVVDTGYVWVTDENMDSASIRNVLYE